MTRLRSISAALLALALTGCPKPSAPTSPAKEGDPTFETFLSRVPDAPWRRGSEAAGREPAVPKGKVLIHHARLLLGDGKAINDGHVLIVDGKIASVGKGSPQDAGGAKVFDAKGKVVTPGLIDTHSHMGVYPSPRAAAHMDGNEMVSPITAGVRAVDAFWPQDPDIQRALAGGVTTIQVLPGSGNLIGGRTVTLKLRPATSSRAMHFVGAPDGLKMACGENPKRVYGTNRKKAPMTRMGNLAGQRKAFADARRLIAAWDLWRENEARRLLEESHKTRGHGAAKARHERRMKACDKGSAPKRKCETWRRKWAERAADAAPGKGRKLPPKRDLHLETLAGAIEGHVLVHIHCYRADDMANMMELAHEQGFAIRSFHHALEAYKIRKQLTKQKISVSTWADWWGFKLEAYDGIPENLAMVHQAGGRAIVHSDSAEGIRRLNQEAAKGQEAGRRRGMTISTPQVMRWITSNPAWALGIASRVGTLAVGKDGDVVIWDRDPMSVYASAEKVFVDGVLRHDKAAPGKPWSDFEAAP